MRYFFVLGNNPALSLAEIKAVLLKETKTEIKGEFLELDKIFIFDYDKKINISRLINQLGGTIKVGRILGNVGNGQEELLKTIKPLLSPQGGKYKFGFSYYGPGHFNIKPVALAIKKYLRLKYELNSQWVVSREKTLSSVVVEQNKLTGKGVEIVLIKDKHHGLLVGRTEGVQPFKDWSKRDYGRPARDSYSGMLPPKLARMMINLLQTSSSGMILDPFCGSGTILTEAIMLGYHNLIGSDVSAIAISATNKNIDWVENKYNLKPVNKKIFVCAAAELDKKIKPASVTAIVTEPYLGPPRGYYKLARVKEELERLYSQSFISFAKILKPGGRVVMIWPIIKIKNSSLFLNPNLQKFKIINPFNNDLGLRDNFWFSERRTFIYGREGQKIWREIVMLELK